MTMAATASVQEIADQYGVCAMTVRRWIWSGRIPATRLGPKLIRLDPEEVNEAITHAVA